MGECMTYQRTAMDEPQPIDENGHLPDGTQVIFYPEDADGGTMRFEAGIFKGNEVRDAREI